MADLGPRQEQDRRDSRRGTGGGGKEESRRRYFGIGTDWTQIRKSNLLKTTSGLCALRFCGTHKKRVHLTSPPHFTFSPHLLTSPSHLTPPRSSSFGSAARPRLPVTSSPPHLLTSPPHLTPPPHLLTSPPLPPSFTDFTKLNCPRPCPTLL